MYSCFYCSMFISISLWIFVSSPTVRIASENGQKSRIYIVKGAKTWSSLTDCSSNQKFKAINCISFLSTTPTFKWSFTGPNNSLIQMIMIQKQLQLQHILSLNCSNIVREATKKNGKKFHTCCVLSPKIENPSPYFTTISATFGTWKSMFFLQLLRDCEWGRWQSLSQRSL